MPRMLLAWTFEHMGDTVFSGLNGNRISLRDQFPGPKLQSFIENKRKSVKEQETCKLKYHSILINVLVIRFSFANTILRDTFIRDCLRGESKKSLDSTIKRSESYAIVKECYPKIVEVKKYISLSSWDEIVGYMSQEYIRNVEQHVFAMLYSRMKKHITLYALSNDFGSIKKENSIIYIVMNDGILNQNDLHYAFKDSEFRKVLPKRIRERMELILQFFDENETMYFPKIYANERN